MGGFEALARYAERIPLLAYWLPTNRIALSLVGLTIALGVAWTSSLLIQSGRLRNARHAIEGLAGMTDLLVSIQVGDREKARTQFKEALLADNIDLDHPVARHVEAVFLAGAVEGRLDVGELLRRTEGKLVAGDQPRRYVLSLFIVIGLLGTLFGLADALVGLSSAAGAQKNFELVLSGLRSAFAPSIWGVAFSIACTFLFARYQFSSATPTLDALRATTLHTWVPLLYPTAGQRFTETMQKGLEAAKEVAEFANDVRQDTGQLRDAVRSSVRATDLFRQRVESLRALFEKADQSFQVRASELLSHTAEGVRALERWTEAEADIRRAQDTLAAHQERHTALLQETRNAIVELGHAFTEMRQATAEEVAAARAAHETMVRGVVAGVEGWRQSTAEHIAAATATNEALVQRFAAALESWRESTIAHVDTQTQELTRRLEAFEVVIRSLKVPFETAADKMSRTALGFQHLVEDALRSRGATPPAVMEIRAVDGSDGRSLQRIERTLVAILRELERKGSDEHMGLRRRFRKWLEA